jgi:hypothetical protein
MRESVRLLFLFCCVAAGTPASSPGAMHYKTVYGMMRISCYEIFIKMLCQQRVEIISLSPPNLQMHLSCNFTRLNFLFNCYRDGSKNKNLLAWKDCFTFLSLGLRILVSFLPRFSRLFLACVNFGTKVLQFHDSRR